MSTTTNRLADALRGSLDADALAAAVDIVLELLDEAQRLRSFPRPGEPPSELDDANEEAKDQNNARELRRYADLRARLGAGEVHGVPVMRQALDSALGRHPTWMPEIDENENPASN
jgi:hypothetical protein